MKHGAWRTRIAGRRRWRASELLEELPSLTAAVGADARTPADRVGCELAVQARCVFSLLVAALLKC